MEKLIFFTLVCFLGGIIIGMPLYASAQESSTIPNWVKNTAKYWANGDLGDSQFIQAIQYLVTQKIIILPNTSISTSSTSQISSSNVQTMDSNPLNKLLPTSSELGSLWKIQGISSPTIFSDIAPSKPILNIKGEIIDANQGQPTYIIEQQFQKASTPLTVTEFKIDAASFGPWGGLSYSDMGSTRVLYSKIITDYQNNHGGYKSTVFIPTPTNQDTTCSLYSSGSTQTVPQQTTTYDMFCIKNSALFMIYVQGSDIGMLDDLKSITNQILKKIN